MDYALVIRALERHVGICERSMQFFRTQRMGTQYSDAVKITAEAMRALREVGKQRDLYELQVSLSRMSATQPPAPFPDDKPLHSDPPPSDVDFADEKLQDAGPRKLPDVSPLKPL